MTSYEISSELLAHNLFIIFRKELSFSKTLHLYNPWNESKSVKIGRDGQVCFKKILLLHRTICKGKIFHSIECTFFSR